MLRRVTILTGLFYVLCTSSRGADVPQFRGVDGDGIARGTKAPLIFSDVENVAWKTDLPGKGWSSPVVSGGKLWVTTAIEVFPTEEERTALLTKAGDDPKVFAQRGIAKAITLKLLKIDLASGEIEKEADLVHIDEPNPIHKTNSYASPTPVLDEGNIFCHFGTYGTYCLKQSDLSLVWERRIPLEHGVGPGSSPFILNDLLVLICDGIDRQFVTALHKSSGEVVWLKDRPEMDAPDGDQKKSFDTPVSTIDRLGRHQLICMGSQWVVAYVPETGEELWKVRHGKGFSVVPRPVVGHGMVYLSTGFGKAELWAIRLDGSGDVTETHVVWKEKRNIPTKPSPLLVGDRIFIINDTGIATCFDAIDGTTIWTERVGGNYSASPLLVDGKIYLANHDGEVIVVQPGDKFKMIAKNIIGGQIMATPIAIEDALFIRTDTALYRFQEGTKAGRDAKVSRRGTDLFQTAMSREFQEN